MTVLAQETAGQQEDTGGSRTEPGEKTETTPAEGTDPEGQEEPGTTEGGGETEDRDDLTGQEPGGGMEEKPQEPGGPEEEQPKPGDGTEGEQPEDAVDTEPDREVTQESEVMPKAALQQEAGRSYTATLELTAEGYDGNIVDFFQVGLKELGTNKAISFNTSVNGNCITCMATFQATTDGVVWYLGETEYVRDTGPKYGAISGKRSNTFYFVRFMNGTNVYDTKYAVKEKKDNFPDTVTAPSAPVREGFTFAGWVTTEGGSELFDFSKRVTGATTLYALWTDDIARGTDWVLDKDGKLTISSNDGVANWKADAKGWSQNHQKVTSLELDPDVTAITDSAFVGCTGLTEITIPDTVISIGESAFATCSNLTKITIPETVTSIGNGMFAGCSKLTDVTLPDNITSIGERMFRECSSLTSITLPESVTSIGEGAFISCGKLQEITIPKAVTEIGRGAFEKCFLFESITFSGDTPPELAYRVFGVDESNFPEGSDDRCGFVKNNTQGIHVPEGKAQTYKDAWTDWAAYIADDTPTPPVETHEHNGVTFTAWTQTDSLPNKEGYYYLTENVTLSAAWDVPNGETTLCLNGKTISISGDACVIQIGSSGTLKLYDCEDTGNITGGKHGGVSNEGIFYMHGGKISGNSARWYGGGVHTSGSFYMYDGEIKGNSASLYGGGVVVGGGTFSIYGGEISGNSGGVYVDGGTVIVGGGATISGNVLNEKENNVYLNDGRTIRIDSETPLSAPESIGITTETAPTDVSPVNITGTNNADYTNCFTSDNADYKIVNGEDNVVQLAVKAQSHIHDYGNWQHDDTQHWKKCACGDEIDRAGHDFGDWITDREATETGEGTKHRDCQTCGYSQTETIPATGQKYTVTVNSGTGGGDYAAGDTVAIKANAPASGKQFNKWEVNSGSVTLASATSSTTIFTMPAEAVTVTATYKNKSGGGHSGGGSGNGHSGDSGNTDGGDSNNGGGDNNNGGGNADGGNNNNGGSDNGSGSSGGSSGGGNGGGTGAGTSGKPGAPGTGQPKVKQEKEGNIWKEVRVEGADTLDAAVATPLSELADIVLTKEEKQKAAGGTDVKVVLDVKDASAVVSAADKALVEKALNGSLAKGYTLGQYFDINLFKVIGDSRGAITETNRKITITIDVPDSLKNTDAVKTRSFAVIRVHDGKAELLADLDDNADTITIETDRFSTYAVVYKDTAGGNSGRQSGNGKPGVVRVSTKSDSQNPGGGRDSEPKTGDSTPLELSATLAMIAGLTYLLLYFADRRHGMTEETKRELVSRLIAWAKQGGKVRTYLALAAVFVLLVYYHSIGKKIGVSSIQKQLTF